MNSKHGSPLTLRHLSQYLLSIYNNYPLNADIRSYRSAYKVGKRIAEHKHTKNAFKAAKYGSEIYGNLNQRGFEDDEDIFVRDLDAEDLFERDYDLLNERDIMDDLD